MRWVPECGIPAHIVKSVPLVLSRNIIEGDVCKESIPIKTGQAAGGVHMEESGEVIASRLTVIFNQRLFRKSCGGIPVANYVPYVIKLTENHYEERGN